MIDDIDIPSYADGNTTYSVGKQHQSNVLNGSMRMAWKLLKVNVIFCWVLT